MGVAPVLIAKGAGATGSDVLVVMTGSGGFGEVGQPVVGGSVGVTDFSMYNTLGWEGNDLLLVAEQGVGCLLQQVQSSFKGSSARTLTLGGRYYTAKGSTVNLASFGTGANGTYAIKLGNALNNPPLFQMFGVGDNATLVNYDLLQLGAEDATVPLAEGVVQIRALYGIDTNNDHKVDTWVDPGVAPYDIGTLLNGSEVSSVNLRRIIAVRVGLILRSALIESDRMADPNARHLDDPNRRYVAPQSINLFEDLKDKGLLQTRDLSDDERRRRHRTVDMTIPLRNMLLI
jgi:type IV pilus assembly protein PilW